MLQIFDKIYIYIFIFFVYMARPTNSFEINRPGVAGAVPNTPLQITDILLK